MEFKNDDAEMARIYNESLHPKGYGEDSKVDVQNNKTSKGNGFVRDFHTNATKYSAKNRAKVPTYNESTKTIVSAMTIVGIIIITLIFIILPMFISK